MRHCKTQEKVVFFVTSIPHYLYLMMMVQNGWHRTQRAAEAVVVVERRCVRGRRVRRRVGRRFGQQRRQVVRIVGQKRSRSLLGQNGGRVGSLGYRRGRVSFEGGVGRSQTGKWGADVEGAVGHLGLDVGRGRRLDGDGRSGQVQLALVTLLQAVLTFKKKPEKI